jgi:hypothetical protein
MFLISRLACRINRHDPMRRKVVWNGESYVGQCRHCGTEIERHSRKNWRKRTAVNRPVETAEG